jgi:hypothetical protein
VRDAVVDAGKAGMPPEIHDSKEMQHPASRAADEN